MELLIVRHGPAGAREDWRAAGRPDSERPLTKDGRSRTKAAAAGLARVAGRVDLVATSPWTRAVQTADLVADALGAKVVEIDALLPDRAFGELLEWLKTRREDRIALVGHEPHLSRFASWLMAGDDRPILRLKKAQAALLEMDTPSSGGAVLAWSLPPRELRSIAD